MEEKNTLTEDQVEGKMEEETENGKSNRSKDGEDHDGKSKKATSTKKSKTNPLKIENEELKKKLEQAKDDYLRLSAEFQNLRKRFEREKMDIVLHANEKFIEMVLPILDDFERSISASESNKSLEGFRNGVELIYKNLVETLEKEGVKPIKSVGEQFDHNLHDALLMTEKKGVKSGTIVEEAMRGYYYKDKVLRHSKVIVAK
jgi:molecular chaperone GrpE